MSFYDDWQQLDWSQLQHQIAASTAPDVERALQASRPSLSDFAALISEAAVPYLAIMAERAQQLTRQRFGQGVADGDALPCFPRARIRPPAPHRRRAGPRESCRHRATA